MTRDMRDPQKLGETLFELRDEFMGFAMTDIANHNDHLLQVPPYANNEGPIEKYGDPADVIPVFAQLRVK